MPSHGIGESLCRLEFLKSKFRLLMDGVAQFQKLGAHSIHSRSDIFLQLFKAHANVSRAQLHHSGRIIPARQGEPMNFLNSVMHPIMLVC